MNIAAYIFSGLFAVCVICSFVIPVKLVKKILNCLIYPLMLGTTVSLLTNHLPDSLHNIVLTSISFVLLSFSVAIYNFREIRKSFDILSSVLQALSFLPIAHFLGAVFFLNHIQNYIVFLAILIYIAIAISMIIILKKQTTNTYIKAFVTYVASAFFNLISLLALIYETRLYAPFLFAGSVIVLLNIIFTVEDTKVFKIKIGALISKISQITGYCLISTGLLLMIAM